MRRRIGRPPWRSNHPFVGRIWQWFGVGMLLGATVVFIRLSVTEISAGRDVSQLPAFGAGTADSARTVPDQAGLKGQAGTGSAKPARGDDSGRAASGGGKGGTKEETEAEGALDRISVRIYLTEENRIETVPLETYVQGVLAGEMPIDFELEALKAQAIAARTYIVRRLSLGDRSGMNTDKADVTDTIEHQVYVPVAQLARKWTGDQEKANLAKLKRAVEETRGLVITYGGEPIQAAFFSTSNGYTENSEEYWDQPLPYLRSVASPWDADISPRYKETVTITKEQFYAKMGLTGKKASAKLSIKVTDRTDGNRIKSLTINGEPFSGREVRERLGLASSQFAWSVKKDAVTITTYGYGHGVGMSQWGANGMAQDGKQAEDILRYYYTGTKVEQASKLPI
ncbi:stage II sporulation protein D [Paenibacillus sp. N4]|uniref:stage II sporulation protein D n=1 Tax=Paenibacillus vietnamensis TaxID=2590547 RepID=UPI001CD0B10B|nr:stage II sporulation protein D [Paenibacillus vietnamensis]MCA0757509.1 stage II sporulation protein D [Paenibacillus vietnamensis]